MEKETKDLSRKKFLFWGIGLSTLFTLPAFLRSSKQKKQTNTVKMLTQDGRLVSIEAENIPKEKEHIQAKEIHNWITKKKSL